MNIQKLDIAKIYAFLKAVLESNIMDDSDDIKHIYAFIENDLGKIEPTSFMGSTLIEATSLKAFLEEKSMIYRNCNAVDETENINIDVLRTPFLALLDKLSIQAK